MLSSAIYFHESATGIHMYTYILYFSVVEKVSFLKPHESIPLLVSELFLLKLLTYISLHKIEGSYSLALDLDFYLRECCGLSDLLSRPYQQIILFYFLIIHMFTIEAILIPARTFPLHS